MAIRTERGCPATAPHPFRPGVHRGSDGRSVAGTVHDHAAARRPSWPSRPWSSGTARWSCASAAMPCTDPNDAQDAFQATFLVLVRKARCALGAGLAGSLAPSGRPSHRLPGAARPRPVGASTSDARPRPGRCSYSSRMIGTTSIAILHEEIDRLPEPLPRAGRALRPGGPDPRTGGPAPGLAGRHGQEPADARPGAAAGRLIRRGMAPAVGLSGVASTAHDRHRRPPCRPCWSKPRSGPRR